MRNALAGNGAAPIYPSGQGRAAALAGTKYSQVIKHAAQMGRGTSARGHSETSESATWTRDTEKRDAAVESTWQAEGL